MSNNGNIEERQLWGQSRTAAPSATASNAWCTPLILPSGGVLVFNDSSTTVLHARVTFKLPCENPQAIISPDTTGNSTVIGFQDPFYASISPQMFVLAAATVISYVLCILIFITPRTFFVGGPGGGAGFLGRRGLSTGSYGGSSVVGIGRRPLLQKVATVTVAISLTIATADTFRIAQYQYNQGYMDSSLVVESVVSSLEIRVVRVISDTFLWLAQVQTLIRLFPRHKEKVTIKWLGFGMVTLDTIFSILNSFVSTQTRTRPRSFQDAIPALNYLFELAISLIYASCVVYFSLSKRRFAFWHPKMKNVCLVALISLVAVLLPVVFFVLDISSPNVAGWGEYIRWVGAAAASVVVWEWVERIESLERDERKDGILGREIFDGDEMLDMTPSEEASWSENRRDGRAGGGRSKSLSVGTGVATRYNRMRARLPLRKRRRAVEPDGPQIGTDATTTAVEGPQLTDTQLTVPQQALTPPSRSDTASAASTVYAIRYHNLTSPSPGLSQDTQQVPQPTGEDPAVHKELLDSSNSDSTASVADKGAVLDEKNSQTGLSAVSIRQAWQMMHNPFKRRRAEPPAEVAGAQIASGMRRSPIDRTINLKNRLGAFASAQKDRLGHRGSLPIVALPITVIPVPQINQRTWSPDDVRNPCNDRTVGTEDNGERDGQPQSTEETNVLTTSAPTTGTICSPDDAHGQGSSRLSLPPSRTMHPTSGRQQPPNEPPQSTLIYTSRGSLTISEDTSRSQSQALGSGLRTALASHPTTYARAAGISPISERLATESPGIQSSHGHGPQDHGQSPEGTAEVQPGIPHSAAPDALGTEVTGAVSMQASEVLAEDHRDTGGTQ